MFPNSTLIETLSTLFTQSLSAFSTPDWQNVREDLTTLTDTVTSLEQAVYSCLSSIPLHPYERLKYEYFGPDHCFKCIDDIEEPIKIPHEQCLEYIRKKNDEVLFTTFHNLTCSDENKIYTAFAYCSCDNVLPDYNKQKNYIGFLEMARNIPLNSITNDNCTVIAKKLIGEYMKTLA